MFFLGAMNGGDEVVAAPMGPPLPLDWKFSQVFGERTAGEEVQEGITLILQYDSVNRGIWRLVSVLSLDPINI